MTSPKFLHFALLLALLSLPALARAADTPYQTDSAGIVPYWLALGPISVSKDEAEKSSVDKDYLGKDADIAPSPGDKVTVSGQEFTWKLATVAPRTPIVQCDESIGKMENAVGYLVSYVVLPQAEPQAKISWGSDDSGVLFVNGKEVDRFPTGRGVDVDQNKTGPIELKAGVNTIVLKLVNRISSWGGCVRLLGSDGKPLAGVPIQPMPAGKALPAEKLWPVVATTYSFEARTYKNAHDKTLLYQIMKPENYDPAKKYPLVLYLHGAGERGSNNKSQLMYITGAYNNQLVSDKMMTQHPCFIVVPQCPEKAVWVDKAPWNGDSSTMTEQPSEPLGLVIELLDTLQK